MNIYYVYEYLREDMTPYYVGKGSNNRWAEKHNVPVPPVERVQFVATSLTEQDAFNLEIELIAKYGRKDLGTGILRNQTNGGDGASGNIHSAETKAKMSNSKKAENAKRKQEGWVYPDSAKHAISKMQKGIPKPVEWVNAVRTSLNSRTNEEKAEWKAKISQANKGKVRSEETKAKLSALNKGKTCSEETKAKIRATKLAKKHG